MLPWLGACNRLGLDGDDERERLEANRAQWRSQGVDSYEFVLRRLCFCGGGTSPAKVVVRNGQRLSVSDLETGEPVPEMFAQYYLTVDELFDFVADAISRKAHRIDVTYDATWGYPTKISIDYIEAAIDEEMAFEASSFLPHR
jgi:hypothetical protein